MKNFKSSKKIGYNLKNSSKLLNKALKKKWKQFFIKETIQNNYSLRKATKEYSNLHYAEKNLKEFFSVKKNKTWLNYKKKKFIFETWCQRLEIALWQSSLTKTINEARNKITKKQVFVNSKIVKSSNYILKKGDVVLLKKNNNNISREYQVINKIPEHLEISYSINLFIYVNHPKISYIYKPFLYL